MEEIWQDLPLEIVAMILEFMCIINIRERLNQIVCGFIIDELQTYNAVITGSFILQCLLNETYEESDIDIFIPHETENCKSSFFPVQSLENTIFNQISVLNDTLCFGTGGSFIGLENIAYSRYYVFPTKLPNRGKINTIVVHGQPKNFINKEFDSDLCSIWYDGKHLNPEFYRLWKHSLCKQMTITLRWHNDSLRIRDRYMKIKKSMHDHRLKSHAFETSCERVKKYMKRGYIVNTTLMIEDKNKYLDKSNMEIPHYIPNEFDELNVLD
jgi:hypothetical protein